MASNGCFIGVLIARTHDRVPLCIYTDENYSNPNSIRQQMQLIIDGMNSPAGTADRAAARGSYYESFDHKECIYYAFQDSGTDLTIVTALNKLLLRNSGDVSGTNKLACSVLDTVFSRFLEAHNVNEIVSQHVRPFQFMKFETALQRCVTQVIQQDRTTGDGVVVGGGSGGGGGGASTAGGAAGGGGGRRQVGQNYEQLRQEITDVHFVMRKNLEDLMQRGEKLDSMGNSSAKLVEQSSKYYGKTVRMNRMRLIKMYGPPAVIGLFLIVFFYFYFF